VVGNVVGKTGLRKFEGVNIQECLKCASVSLGVPEESIKYSILEEKKGLFRKHAIISIDAVEGLNTEDNAGSDTALEGNVEQKILEEINGTIEIALGEFIIKNPKEGGRPAVISTVSNIMITVNGEKVGKRTPVYEESIIKVIFQEDEAKRQLDLSISLDKMEAYISINYKPKTTYKLKDEKITNSMIIGIEVKEEIMPPKFTESEIKSELLKNNIKYGILKMSLIKCLQSSMISKLLIANGKKVVEAIDDRIQIEHNETTDENHDNEEFIDYKAIGTVQGVEIGQVLAILCPGKNGEDGEDITGKIVKSKNAKKIILGAGEGCTLLDEFTVVATSQGKPSTRGSIFYVYKTHEVTGDVELKTGNIQFVGDVVVTGSVREGMSVESGNSILVKNNVADAVITASGDVVIGGNVINSTISAGKEDVLTLEYLSDLNSMKDDLTKVIACVMQIKQINLIQKNNSDGELIKILLETKFKKLPQTSIRIAKRMIKQNIEDELLSIIKHKLLDLGPFNIKSYEELNDIVTIIDNKINILERNLTLPVDVMLDYCQDSIVKSSGNITFSGKGEYVSQIIASDSIIFEMEKSLARGGVIKAGKEIRCKVVGGLGGVSTKLIVEKHGHIWAEIAYPNTRFIIGEREYVLDVPSKNIHVFMNDDREIVVDKLLL